MKKISLFFVSATLLLIASCGDCTKNCDEKKDSNNKEKVITKPNTLTEEEKEAGWELLFDGTSVDKWRGYNKDSFPANGWQVIDGTLQVMGSGQGEAGHGGDIITKNTYENFEFTMEWKVSEGGNSGIFYLAEEIDGVPIWKNAPEMQILDNTKHPDAQLGKNGNRQAGSLYDMIPANPQNAKTPGQWNKVKIMVYDGTVVHFMNGETVVEYHLWTDDWKEMVANSKFSKYPEFVDVAKEGHIGLQDHGDDVWFRNLKIRKL